MKNILLSLTLFALAGCFSFSEKEPPPSEQKTQAKRNEDGAFINSNGIVYEKPFSASMQRQIDGFGGDADPIVFPLAENNPAFLKANRNKITLTWLGHSGFLYQNQHHNILIDPHLSERSSFFSWEGPERHTPPGLSFTDLPKIDLVAISHDHYDHLDEATILRLHQENPDALFLVPLELDHWFREQGITKVRTFDWWETAQLKQTKITFLPAQHWSGRGMGSRNKTLWGGWRFDSPNHSFMHLGDSGYSADFDKIRQRTGPVAMAAIPIGGYAPRWFMRFSNMDPQEAVQAFVDLEATSAVAMHWGTFSLTDEPMDEPPKKLLEALDERGISEDKFMTLQHGQTLLLSPIN